ncbi:MAG: nucleotide exchange factor GrpE [Candidatus Dormibacteraeota bacterium]|nr:nucleotide exchange factor GrpE [Candidatus Dormibacteraeota bacterium]MBV9526511.1 nucleotide exchange factor GrpE [Candidatus Dormibacteraeota bacterium]
MTPPPERPRTPRHPVDIATETEEAPPAAPVPASESDVPGLDDLRARLAELEDRYLRLAADFENYKRRKTQELADRSRYASEDAARAMLPVLDNLRRAVEHAPEGGAEEFFVNGLQLVVREFEAALERLGVSRVQSVGEPFDPALHEAIGGEEADVEHDTVSDELVAGYRLHDRLLRPAMVRVAHPRSTPATD